jgi:putative FmdB family regulatory protein
MPLYEYQCDACGARFEVIQKFSDAPVESCGGCGGPVKKLLSSPAIQFKGSGWYVTDYARKGGSSSGAAAAGAGATSGEASSGDSKAGEAKSSDAQSKPAKTDV